MTENELYHHGILGQKWGIRRFQNEDGSLTEAGRKRLDRKDARWARRNEKKIYKSTYKDSRKEIREYDREVLKPYYKSISKRGKLGNNYVNAYNRALAVVMNKNVADIEAPSGRVVRFVAKRGEMGVHMALADRNYDMDQLKNGVWASGKIAYRNQNVDMA